MTFHRRWTISSTAPTTPPGRSGIHPLAGPWQALGRSAQVAYSCRELESGIHRGLAIGSRGASPSGRMALSVDEPGVCGLRSRNSVQQGCGRSGLVVWAFCPLLVGLERACEHGRASRALCPPEQSIATSSGARTRRRPFASGRMDGMAPTGSHLKGSQGQWQPVLRQWHRPAAQRSG